MYGVDAVIVRDDEGIGSYVSKINFELARSDLKIGRDGKGRTPWQVGVDAIKPETPKTQPAGKNGSPSATANEPCPSHLPSERPTQRTRQQR